MPAIIIQTDLEIQDQGIPKLNKITECEKQLIVERYNFYCQFNFPEIALNRITWDFGHDIKTIKSILREKQNETF